MSQMWTCPDAACAATNKAEDKYCERCGTERGKAPAEAPKPTTSCWTCDKCGSRSPGHPVLYQDDGPNGSPRGLCSPCHFDERIRPHASRAEDLCTADGCAGETPHRIGRHIAMMRHHVARIEARNEEVRL